MAHKAMNTISHSKTADGAQVTEKPILFSGAMVRAILAGTKSQTRRVMRDQPDEGWSPHSYGEVHRLVNGEPDPEKVMGWGPCDEDGHAAYACPYGEPDKSRLWVKETFMPDPYINSCASTSYRATEAEPDRYTGHNWKPSTFMPRIRSRITLEIIAVRVERLQDISAKDILAEGAVERSHQDQYLGKCPISAFDGNCYPDLKSLWAHGWESINGKGSWAKNNWVWVLEFKKL